MLAALALACLVTLPSGNVHGTYACPGDYGNDALLVTLQPELEFRDGGPGFVLRDGSYQWKFAWCRKARGKLSIEGHRLDGHAAPLRAAFTQTSEEPGFTASYLIFPTAGCWQVTATLAGTKLTFVTRVVDHRKRK